MSAEPYQYQPPSELISEVLGIDLLPHQAQIVDDVVAERVRQISQRIAEVEARGTSWTIAIHDEIDHLLRQGDRAEHRHLSERMITAEDLTASALDAKIFDLSLRRHYFGRLPHEMDRIIEAARTALDAPPPSPADLLDPATVRAATERAFTPPLVVTPATAMREGMQEEHRQALRRSSALLHVAENEGRFELIDVGKAKIGSVTFGDLAVTVTPAAPTHGCGALGCDPGRDLICHRAPMHRKPGPTRERTMSDVVLQRQGRLVDRSLEKWQAHRDRLHEISPALPSGTRDRVGRLFDEAIAAGLDPDAITFLGSVGPAAVLSRTEHEGERGLDVRITPDGFSWQAPGAARHVTPDHADALRALFGVDTHALWSVLLYRLEKIDREHGADMILYPGYPAFAQVRDVLDRARWVGLDPRGMEVFFGDFNGQSVRDQIVLRNTLRGFAVVFARYVVHLLRNGHWMRVLDWRRDDGGEPDADLTEAVLDILAGSGR